MKKRIISILLLTALICSSCGSENAETGQDETSAPTTSETTAGAETDEFGREFVASALPEKLDFKDTTISFWCRNDNGFDYEFAVEESNGDVMNDVVFNRNRKVEERLGVKFEFKTVSFTNTTEIPELQTSIMAGSGDYDIAAVHCSQGAQLVTIGAYRDFNSAKYIDLDKPWWNQTLVDELNVYDFLPMLCGDISLSATMRTNVTFFNKKLYDQYYDENIYDVVKEGKWTLDKLKEMTKDVYRDTDGNGKMDGNDFYALGFMSAATPLDAFVAALDLSITTKNADAIPELSFYSERTINAFEKLTDIVMNNPGTYTNPRSEAAGALLLFRQKFLDGGIIFNFTNILETEYLRDMTDGYGILPLPKYDENQDGYYTLPHNAFSMMVVPSDSQKFDEACAALEALAEESYRSVTPTYYEVALGKKYFHDDESAQMFDLIMKGIKLNFGSVYQTTQIGTIGWLIRDLSQEFSSTYAANKNKYETAMQNLLDGLKALGESN